MTDRLLGLKENVIIGKLIPARATIDLPPEPVREFFLPGLRPDGMHELPLAMGEDGEDEDTREIELEALMTEPFESEDALAVAEDEAPAVPQTYFAEPDDLDEDEEEEEAEAAEEAEETEEEEKNEEE